MENLIKKIGDKLIKGKWNLLSAIIFAIQTIGSLLLVVLLSGAAAGLTAGDSSLSSIFKTYGIMIIIFWLLVMILVSRFNILAIIDGIFAIVINVEALLRYNSAMNQFGLGAYSTFGTNLYSYIATIVFSILLLLSGIIGMKYKKMNNSK